MERFSLQSAGAGNPGFTTLTILILTLGIGANTAIFSLVDGVLLRPLPYLEPESLVRIFMTDAQRGSERAGTSYADFFDWREGNATFRDLSVHSYWTFNLTGREMPERILGVRVSGNWFSVLGAKPLLGRVLLEDDDVSGSEERVVISYGLWQRSFGGDPGIVGAAVTLNGRPHVVVGVMPSTFRFPDRGLELWGTLEGNLGRSRTGRFLEVVGRLRPETTTLQAQSDMENIVGQLANEYPDTNTGWEVLVVPLHEAVTGNVHATLMILLGAVGLVLLIVCTNVINLNLARAKQRQQERSVRPLAPIAPVYVAKCFAKAHCLL